jgi:dTDP-4-amino-4,6-dideoxygalactose transaminase
LRIPFLELLPTYTELQSDIDAAITEAMNSGWYIGGKLVEKFECEFADYCGVNGCVTVGNGLDALKLALIAHNLKPGDQVLVPSHTFIATWLAVTSIGCIPVPLDISPTGYLVSQDDFLNCLTPDIKAAIPVLLYGQTGDYSKLIAECDIRGIPVIIDAAQAHGAWASSGLMLNECTHCWSFYPGKNLGAFGDGGAITSNNLDIVSMCRQLGNYGSTVKYHHEVLGLNSRLDPIQCAILSIKLRHLDIWNNRRRRIAALYNEHLHTVSTPISCADSSGHVYHLYVIQCNRRDELRRYMSNRDIGTQIHYPIPVHKQRAYSSYSDCSLPNSERVANQILSLPIGPHVTDEDVMSIVRVVNSFNDLS